MCPNRIVTGRGAIGKAAIRLPRKAHVAELAPMIGRRSRISVRRG